MSCNVKRVCLEEGCEYPKHVKKTILIGSNITVIEDLSECCVVEKVDFSKNNISDAGGLRKCESIAWLNLSHNVLSSLEFITRLRKLTVLNLGYNSISDTSHVGSLRSLKALILNNNKITQVSGLDQLVHLNTLVLSHNQIEQIEVGTLSALVKLQLSHNVLKFFPDIRFNFELKCLLLNENRIARIPDDHVGDIHKLEIVEIGNNSFKKLKHIKPLSTVKSIIRLNLLGNGFCSEPEYVCKVRSMFPAVKNLNTQPIHKLHHSADKVSDRAAKRKVFDSEAEDDSAECKTDVVDDTPDELQCKKIRTSNKEANVIQPEALETVEESERKVDVSVSDSFRKKSKKSASDFDSSVTNSSSASISVEIPKILQKKKEGLPALDDRSKSLNSDNGATSVSIDITKKNHKKKKLAACLDDSSGCDVTLASFEMPKQSHKKKKGVPAMDNRNSGVVKVIEIRKNKRKPVSGVELDSYETPFGSGIGGSWM